MKLQLTQILKDELAKSDDKLPSWIDTFLYVINTAINQISTAFKNNITFADNMNSKVVTVKLTHNVEYSVSPILPGQKQAGTIIGAWPILATGSSVANTKVDRNVITGFGVNLKSDGSLGIVAQFSQGEKTSANVTFIIQFG